jgi:hypothetical protein
MKWDTFLRPGGFENISHFSTTQKLSKSRSTVTFLLTVSERGKDLGLISPALTTRDSLFKHKTACMCITVPGSDSFTDCDAEIDCQSPGLQSRFFLSERSASHFDSKYFASFQQLGIDSLSTHKTACMCITVPGSDSFTDCRDSFFNTQVQSTPHRSTVWTVHAYFSRFKRLICKVYFDGFSSSLNGHGSRRLPTRYEETVGMRSPTSVWWACPR